MPFDPTVFVDGTTALSAPPGTPPIDHNAMNKLGNGIQTAQATAETAVSRTTDLPPLNGLDYIISGTTVDTPRLWADAVSKGYRSAYFPAGIWTAPEWNVPLDSDDDFGRFMMFGDGQKTRWVPPASGTGSLFVANSTSDAALPSHPHLVFRDMSMFSASGDPAINFLTKFGRSLHAENLYFVNGGGITSNGYSDTDRLVGIHARNVPTGAWTYDREGLGDGIVLENFFVYACAGIKMKNARPASIVGLLGGWHQFIECVIEDISGKIEGDGGTYTNDLFTLNGGWYDLSKMVLHATPWRNAVTVDDQIGSNNRKTYLTLGPDTFVQKADTPGSAFGAVKCTDLHIVSLNKASRIRFDGGLRSHLFGQDTLTGATSAPVYDQILPKIVSDDSTITTALTTRPALLGADVELVYRNAAWALSAPVPFNGLRTTRKATNAIFVSASAASGSGWGFDMPNASTKFYVAAVTDIEGRSTAASPETSATTSSGQPVILLGFNTQLFPCILTIWRGATTGARTEFVQIPIGNTVPALIDQGTCIAGQVWSSTSVPAVPSTNDTFDGFVVIGTDGRPIIFSHGAPTSGTWPVGAVALEPIQAAGTPFGYVCVTAGTPGTWLSLPNPIVKTGTASLTAGTVTIADTNITANSEIVIYRRNVGTAPGALYVSAHSTSTSFTVTSTNGADNGSFRYEIRAY